MWYTRLWHYAMDPKHGFGILSDSGADKDTVPCFFEDGTYENVRLMDVYMDKAATALLEEGGRRGRYYSARDNRLADSMAAESTCTLFGLVTALILP